MTPRRRCRESVRIAVEAVATSALRRASLVWRFHSSTSRGCYGEESEEGQDREEGQEVKSQKEEVVFCARADTAPPGQSLPDRKNTRANARFFIAAAKP